MFELLKGKTLISGADASGKSTLLTAVAQKIMNTNPSGAILYYGTSLSYEKYAAEKKNDTRFQFLPVYEFPFNKHAPGVRKLITAVQTINQFPTELMIAIDEPHHLLPDQKLAREFAQTVKELKEREKRKLNLVMTTKTAESFTELFGDELLYEFENHLVLQNKRQAFYEPVIVSDLIPPGAVVPIICGQKKAPITFELGNPESLVQIESSVSPG